MSNSYSFQVLLQLDFVSMLFVKGCTPQVCFGPRQKRRVTILPGTDCWDDDLYVVLCDPDGMFAYAKRVTYYVATGTFFPDMLDKVHRLYHFSNGQKLLSRITDPKIMHWLIQQLHPMHQELLNQSK